MKLTREEFADALRKGKGRAWQYVRDQGDASVEDVLLGAAQENLCYDSQVDGCRADWLMEMIDRTHQPAFYYDHVVANFINTTDTWDVQQQSGILLQLGRREYPGAKKVLYDKFELQEFNETWLMGREIIELDAIPGLLRVADVLGRRMLRNPDFWEDNGLLNEVQGFVDPTEAEKALRSAAAANPNIRAYVNHVVARSECLFSKKTDLPKKTEESSPMSLEEFLNALEQETRWRNARMLSLKFGRRASQDDLKRLLLLLAAETNQKKIREYLWVFYFRELPELPEVVFAHAASSDEQTRDAALSALSNSTHLSVRKFALDELSAGRLDVLELFIRNYADGDFKLIRDKLRPTEDRDEMFSTCRVLLNICDEHNSTEAADCLLWVYEHTPCAHCRGSAVAKLLATKSLPPVFAEECLFDCEKETRALIGRH